MRAGASNRLHTSVGLFDYQRIRAHVLSIHSISSSSISCRGACSFNRVSRGNLLPCCCLSTVRLYRSLLTAHPRRHEPWRAITAFLASARLLTAPSKKPSLLYPSSARSHQSLSATPAYRRHLVTPVALVSALALCQSVVAIRLRQVLIMLEESLSRAASSTNLL
jgi:hypothetical protein